MKVTIVALLVLALAAVTSASVIKCETLCSMFQDLMVLRCKGSVLHKQRGNCGCWHNVCAKVLGEECSPLPVTDFGECDRGLVCAEGENDKPTCQKTVPGKKILHPWEIDDQ